MPEILKPSEVAAMYDIRKKANGEHIVHEVSERCYTCKYISGTKDKRGDLVKYDRQTCDYIGMTGRARRCPAGDLCTKYEKGDGINDNSIADLDLDR